MDNKGKKAEYGEMFDEIGELYATARKRESEKNAKPEEIPHNMWDALRKKRGYPERTDPQNTLNEAEKGIAWYLAYNDEKGEAEYAARLADLAVKCCDNGADPGRTDALARRGEALEWFNKSIRKYRENRKRASAR